MNGLWSGSRSLFLRPKSPTILMITWIINGAFLLTWNQPQPRSFFSQNRNLSSLAQKMKNVCWEYFRLFSFHARHASSVLGARTRNFEFIDVVNWAGGDSFRSVRSANDEPKSKSNFLPLGRVFCCFAPANAGFKSLPVKLQPWLLNEPKIRNFLWCFIFCFRMNFALFGFIGISVSMHSRK